MKYGMEQKQQHYPTFNIFSQITISFHKKYAIKYTLLHVDNCKYLSMFLNVMVYT
jgi:acyl-ACP thioesterase